MRYDLLMTGWLMLLPAFSVAAPVGVETARQVASRFFEGTTAGLRSGGEPRLVYPSDGLRSSGSSCYVFERDGGEGFVLVAGDDRMRPVLGYSESGSWVMPEGHPVHEWISLYEKEWRQLDDTTVASDAVREAWEDYLRGSTSVSDGVLLPTAAWGQNDPFNRMTPLIGDAHTPTGCMATSMAIVMRYHGYPVDPMGDFKATYKVGSESRSTTVSRREAYDWDEMPLGLREGSSSWDKVATLMYHAGLSVHMNYDIDGSGAYLHDCMKAMREVFGYDDAMRYLKKENYSWTDWLAMIRAEIDEGRPLLYAANSLTSAHAFVADGYEGDFVHFNWGWRGSLNGYFLLTAMDPDGSGDGYNRLHMMCTHIEPRTGEPAPDVWPMVSQSNYYGVLPTLTTRTVFIYDGRPGDRFTFALGRINADGAIQRVYEETWGHTFPGWDDLKNSSWLCHFSITEEEPLNAGEWITPVATKDGESWHVLPVSIDAHPGYGPDGQIPTEEDEYPGGGATSGCWPLKNELLTNPIIPAVGLGADGAGDHSVRLIQVTHASPEASGVINGEIRDYEAWKGGVALRYALGEGDSERTLEVAEDGTFQIVIGSGSFGDTGTATVLLRLLGDRRGTMRMDLRYCDKETVIMEEKAVLEWIEPIECRLKDQPVRGEAGKPIPVYLATSRVDELIREREMTVNFYIDGLSEDEVTLYDSSLAEIPLSEVKKAGGGTALRSAFALPVGTVGNPSLPLYVKVDGPTDERRVLLYYEAYADGVDLPHALLASRLEVLPLGSGIASPDPTSLTARGETGALVVQGQGNEHLVIVDLQGKVRYEGSLVEGTARIPLPGGVYIVLVEDASLKVMVH